jgi:hypothetical protein
MAEKEITVELKADLTQPIRRLKQIKQLVDELRAMQARASAAESLLISILREDEGAQETRTTSRFDKVDEALIEDLVPVLRKHGMEIGCLTRELAEFVVLCLNAEAHLHFYRMNRTLGDRGNQMAKSSQ